MTRRKRDRKVNSKYIQWSFNNFFCCVIDKKKTSVNLTTVAKNIAQPKIYLFFRISTRYNRYTVTINGTQAWECLNLDLYQHAFYKISVCIACAYTYVRRVLRLFTFLYKKSAEHAPRMSLLRLTIRIYADWAYHIGSCSHLKSFRISGTNDRRVLSKSSTQKGLDGLKITTAGNLKLGQP